MMGRLILFLLQLVVGWFVGQAVVEKWFTFGGRLGLLIYAVVFAVLAWICGLVAAELLQGVEKPSQRTLLVSLAVAAIAAAGLIFVPQVKSYLSGVPEIAVVLAGAVLGYHMRR
jgi:hypothetical protein